MFATFLAVFESVSRVEKLLAVVGGFVLGALLTGLIVNVITRLTTGQKLPRIPIMVVRVLGGIIAGWLVMLWVMGGGGFGIGGSGGWGVGSGTGTGPSNTRDKDGNNTYSNNETEKEKEKGKAVSPPQTVPTLRIEVLGPTPLKELAGKKPFDLDQCYRVSTPDGRKLLTLAEVKKLIDPSEDEPAWRRIMLVIYNDSPNKDNRRVEDLKKWAETLLLKDPKEKIRVDFYEPEENAPLK